MYQMEKLIRGCQFLGSLQDHDMVYGDGLTTREDKDSRLFFSQHQPKVISLHSKIRHRPQQKSIIPHITLVAFVASVAMFITD